MSSRRPRNFSRTILRMYVTLLYGAIKYTVTLTALCDAPQTSLPYYSQRRRLLWTTDAVTDPQINSHG